MTEPKSKTSIAFERVGCYRVNGHILTSVSKWNGLEELRDEKGRKLIVWMLGGTGPGFHGLFEKLFGQSQDGVLEPIVGDLELMAELRSARDADAASVALKADLQQRFCK